MITIKKKGNVCSVPVKAFDEYFKPHGWEPIEQENANSEAESEASTDYSKMKVDKLRTLASEQGFETEGKKREELITMLTQE